MEIGNECWMVGNAELVSKYGFNKKMDKLFETEDEAKKYQSKNGGHLIHIKGLFIITINYKSGNTVTGAFYKFECSSDLKNISWIHADGKGYPDPLYIGISNIESIWIKKNITIYIFDDIELYRSEQ